MKKIIIPILAAVLCITLFTGCSGAQVPEGTWTADTGKSYEFVDTGYVESGSGGKPEKGTIAVDGSTLYLYPDGFDHTAGETDKTLVFDGSTLYEGEVEFKQTQGGTE